MMEEGLKYNTTRMKMEGSAVVDMLSSSNLTCNLELLPSIKDYYKGLDFTTSITVFTLGSVACLAVLYLYADTLWHLLRNGGSSTKTHSVFVISIYPVVAVATLCAIVVPRAQLVAEAVIQVTFMSCLYQLFCLFVAYCDGETGIMHKASPKALNLRVGPCCCWPCCFCLPSITLTKERVNMLRLLVLQLPIIQGLCYLVQLVMWAEEEVIYQVNNNYIQPIILTSILFGVWGVIMTVKLLVQILKKHSILGKYIVLQLVLVLSKFQALGARIAVWAGTFACRYPLTPSLYANLIYNSVMLWQMVILIFFARILYKEPIPESYSTVKHSNLPHKISTMSEKIANPVMYSENVNNNRVASTTMSQNYISA